MHGVGGSRAAAIANRALFSCGHLHRTAPFAGADFQSILEAVTLGRSEHPAVGLNVTQALEVVGTRVRDKTRRSVGSREATIIGSSFQGPAH
jgi:hypothetical protein